MEVTIKIDERSKQAKALLEYIKTLPFVEIKDKDEEKSSYNPEFVAKIRRAEKEKSTTVDPNDIWESLGLK